MPTAKLKLIKTKTYIDPEGRVFRLGPTYESMEDALTLRLLRARDHMGVPLFKQVGEGETAEELPEIPAAKKAYTGEPEEAPIPAPSKPAAAEGVVTLPPEMRKGAGGVRVVKRSPAPPPTDENGEIDTGSAVESIEV